MIPTEILTLFGGSITGFIFKFMAQRSQDNQKKFEMLMKRNNSQKRPGMLQLQEPVVLQVNGLEDL